MNSQTLNEVTMIGGLPNNLLQYLFSFLDPKDLQNMSKQNRKFAQLVRQWPVWQVLIRHYFPYLIASHSHEFRDNPKDLFLKEYQTVMQFYKKGIDEVDKLFFNEMPTLKSLFQSLKQFGRLEGASNTTILAAGAGDKTALDQLSGLSTGTALAFAAWRGNHKAVEMILREAQYISAEDKGKALKNASACAHVEIVKTLLSTQQGQLQTEYISKSLKIAAEEGLATVVSTILAVARARIGPMALADAMERACIKGHVAVVEMLLEIKIASIFYGPALVAAAKNGHQAIVELFLKRKVEYLSRLFMVLSLHAACKRGHLSVVRTLLSLEGSKFTYEDIGQAIRESMAACKPIMIFRTREEALIQCNYMQIVKLFLSVERLNLSDEVREQALKFIRNYDLDTPDFGLPIDFLPAFNAQPLLNFSFSCDVIPVMRRHWPILKHVANELGLNEDAMDVDREDEIEEAEEVLPKQKRARH